MAGSTRSGAIRSNVSPPVASSISSASEPVEPRVELPPHPRDERRGGEPPFVTPAADVTLAVLRLGLHHDPVACETEPLEPREQVVGEHLGRERGLVDARRGRVELEGLHQVGGRRDGRCNVLGSTGREAMRMRAVDAEPREHRRRGERSEITERSEAEPAQQIGERGALLRSLPHRIAQDHDRPRREERRRAIGRDHVHTIGCRGTGRQPGGEPPVGDADTRVGDPRPLGDRQQPGGEPSRHLRSSGTGLASGT